MKEISIYSFHKYHFLRLEMIVTYKRLSVTGGQSMTTVNESYKYCHQIMKKYSKSFSYAFDLLPESERRAVWAVYAVCRIIDDSIDEEQNPQKLQAIKEDIQLIQSQQVDSPDQFKSNQRIMLAFYDTSQNYKMEYQSFYNLIESVFEDEHFEMFVKDEELMRYCYGVAGIVGEVLSPILAEQPSDETYEVARELGEALQLTNILRDVGEDFEKGRIYFSQEMLNQYDVNIEDVYQHQPTDNYIKLWEHYAQIAEKDYQFALDHLHVFKPEARSIIELAARIYKGIIDEVREYGYPLHRRVYVSRLDKLHIYRQVKDKYNK